MLFRSGYRPPQRKEVTLVSAEEQTAGRGQQGNSWEAEKGKNLLFSLRIHPHTIEAAQQFILSQALALSLKRTPDDYTSDTSIKWPNDIYWKDKKIAGILIENELTGKQITSSVLGVGLNINQTVFHSDAPNPVSLAQIIGHEEERQLILESIIGNFTSLLAIIEKGETEEIGRAHV